MEEDEIEEDEIEESPQEMPESNLFGNQMPRFGFLFTKAL
jgi:hypothetical protein